MGYDPHRDPAPQFASGCSQIEAIIDSALASGDQEKMRDAQRELKHLQETYLAWTGKAERISFEVDTVSLHVHERIDSACILSAVRKNARKDKSAQTFSFEPGLFYAQFENLPLRQALDFDKHEQRPTLSRSGVYPNNAILAGGDQILVRSRNLARSQS